MVKRSLAILLTVCIMTAMLPAMSSPAQAASLSQVDVFARIATILSVYPSGSYFNRDGSDASGACSHASGSTCNNCRLSNIPARGGLPSGATVAGVCVDGWTCIAFARYVFYNIFGISEKNSNNTTVNGLSTAVMGDYIRCLRSDGSVAHAGIFMGWATPGSTFYLYEGNDGKPTKVAYKVREYSAVNHSTWKSFTTTHAYNYSSSGTTAVQVAFSNNDRASVATTNAVLAKTISVSGASIDSVSEVGVRLYNASGTKLAEKSEKPVASGSVINAWYDVNSELNVTLSAGTSYSYHFFAKIAGQEYASETFTFKTNAAGVSINFTDNSQQNIGTTNAVLARTINIANGSIGDITQVGVRLYNSLGNYLAGTQEKPVPAGSVINVWYDVNSELNYTLSPGTEYKYEFFAVHGGNTYTSARASFTTAGTGVSVSYADYAEKQSVDTTNASLAKTLSVSGAAISAVTEVGIDLYLSNGQLYGSKREKPYPLNGVINQWYDVNSELGVTLTPGTTYYYQMVCTINGTVYKSPMFSFVTKPILVSSVSLSQYTLTLDISAGQPYTLTASCSPANATNTALSWSSNNTAVATVENGVITPVGVGYASIFCHATDGSGAYASCALEVVNTMAVNGVEVLGTTAGLTSVGQTITWKVAATAGGTLSYYYSLMRNNEAYDAEGWVSGNTFSYTMREAGDYCVKVTVRNEATGALEYTTSAMIQVKPQLESLSLRSALKMAASGYGSRFRLEAAAYPANSLYGTMTWSSSDESVVSVDQNGALTAYKAGTATITVQEQSGVSASCTVTVKPSFTTLQLPDGLTEIEAEAFAGSGAELVVLPAGVTTIGDGAFSSMKELQFVVMQDGITAIGDGVFASAEQAAILTTQGSVASFYAEGCGMAWYDVNASYFVPMTSLKITPEAMSLNPFEYGYLTAEFAPANATNSRITWSSSNDAVASVDGGVVVAHAPGMAIISAKATDGTGLVASCAITVNEVPVTGLVLNSTAVTLNPGNTAVLSYAVSPINATNTNVRWFSSNNSVATVSDGVITAVGAGTANITVQAADGYGASAVCKVTVNAPVTAQVSFSGLQAVPSSTNANLKATANANISGTFATYGVNVWDANGALIVNNSATSVTAGTSMVMDYNITNNAGVSLAPGSTYTWKAFVTFDGITFWSELQSFTTESMKEITFTAYSATPTANDAKVDVTAVAETTGQFTNTGVRVWDSTGKLVASCDETNVNRTMSSMQIWYNIIDETGSTLQPGSTYTWQVYTTYNGTVYWSDIQRFTTSEANAPVSFADFRCSATDTNVYVSVTATRLQTGNFTGAALRILNSDGSVRIYLDEKVTRNADNMDIWYDAANESGIRLTPNTSYSVQIGAQFEGVMYWSAGTSFMTAAATNYNSSLSNETILANLQRSSVLSAEKKDFLIEFAREMLNAGYKPAFVAGALANMLNEGAPGLFERTSKCPYSGQYIYNGMKLSDVNSTLNSLSAAGWPNGKFGLGSVQWTAGRSLPLMNYYIQEAGGSDTINYDQVLSAEIKLLKYELSNSYKKSVVNRWSNDNASDYWNMEAAFNAGYRFCVSYEVPAKYYIGGAKRGGQAASIFAAMMGY